MNTETSLTTRLNNTSQGIAPQMALNAMVIENPSELSSIGTFHFNTGKVNMKNFEK